MPRRRLRRGPGRRLVAESVASASAAPAEAERDAESGEKDESSAGAAVRKVMAAGKRKAATAAGQGEAARPLRRARLTVRHIDPWSALKFSLVLGGALFVVWMVAIGLLYGVLNGMGVFSSINSTVNELNGSTGNVITPQLVLAAAAVLGAVSIVLFAALATVGSFIYNLCADLVGGLEVTLAEHD